VYPWPCTRTEQARERNIAIREFKLNENEINDLKKTSRKMKLLFVRI
jgi:hypothetical protein